MKGRHRVAFTARRVDRCGEACIARWGVALAVPLVALAVAAIVLSPMRVEAAWVLPPGQESAVLGAINTAFPGQSRSRVQIEASRVVVTFVDEAQVELTRRDDGGLVVRAVGSRATPDISAAQLLLDTAALRLAWQEVADDKPRAPPGSGVEAGVDAGVAAGVARPAGSAGRVDSPRGSSDRAGRVARLVERALDLESRAGHGRERTTQEAIAAVQALPEAECPPWLRLRLALLLQAAGQVDVGQQLARDIGASLGRIDEGANPASVLALRVRSLAYAGDDAGAIAAAVTEARPSCDVAALLDRDVALRAEATFFANARRLVASHGTCAALYAPIVVAVRRAGAIETGAELLSAGLQARPDDPFIARQLAYIRSRQGRTDEVFELLDRALRAPTFSEVDLVDLSHIATSIRAPDAWVAALRARAESAPDDADIAFLLGVVLHYRDDWQRSDTWLQRAATKHAEIPRLLIYRAMNHYRMHNHDVAAPLIQRAALLHSEDPDVLYCRGVIFLDQDPAAAKRDFQSYLEGTSGTAEVNAGKQARVRQTIIDLDACGSAESPRACVERQEQLRTWGPRAGVALGALTALLLGLWLRRRRWAAVSMLWALVMTVTAAALIWTPALASAASPDRVRRTAGHAIWVDTGSPPPRALMAQLSWLDGLDIMQLAVAAALWLFVAAALFFWVRPRSSAPSPRYRRPSAARWARRGSWERSSAACAPPSWSWSTRATN